MRAAPAAAAASFRAAAEPGLRALGRSLGSALATALRGRRALLVGLDGELGAGKTTLVAAALEALGVRARIASPSYGLVHPYRLNPGADGAAREALHVDLYRVRQPVEMDELDLPGGAGGAGGRLLLVEWFENARGCLGEPDVALLLRHAEPGRRVKATGASRSGERIVDALRRARHPELVLDDRLE